MAWNPHIYIYLFQYSLIRFERNAPRLFCKELSGQSEGIYMINCHPILGNQSKREITVVILEFFGSTNKILGGFHFQTPVGTNHSITSVGSSGRQEAVCCRQDRQQQQF